MRRRTIAVLIDTLGGDYQDGMHRATLQVAEDFGVDLITVLGRPLGGDRLGEAAQNIVYQMIGPVQADGLVVISGVVGGFVPREELAKLCLDRGVPVVSVGLELPGIPSVIIDNRAGMAAVVSHLVAEHGCRRIAFIGGPPNNEEAEERRLGYEDALRRHGVALDPSLLATGDFNPWSGRACAAEMLELGAAEDPMDALVAANDLMALGALEALGARGLRAPHDLLVAGFDDCAESRHSSPALTTVRQTLAELVRSAFSLLARQWSQEAIPPVTKVAVEIVPRESCGCAYRVLSSHTAKPPESSLLPVKDLVRARRALIARTLEQRVRLPPEALGGWIDRLLDALVDGGAERDAAPFLRTLEDLLAIAQREGRPIDELRAAVGVLRDELRQPEARAALEDVWLAAAWVVGAADAREQAHQRMVLVFMTERLSRGLEQLSATLEQDALCGVLLHSLPELGVRDAAILLFSEDERTLIPLFAMVDGAAVKLSRRFPREELELGRVLPGHDSRSMLMLPLTSGEQRQGVMLVGEGALTLTYPLLQGQVGAALRNIALHHSVLREAAARAERLQLEAAETQARLDAQRALLESVARMARGDLDSPIRAGSDTDAQHLAEAVDELRLAVKAQIEELERQNTEICALNMELRRRVELRSELLYQAGARASVPPPSAVVPGDRLGDRYRVVRRIGEGGMGAVFEVERVTDGAHLAAKVLTSITESDAVSRFAREARVLARLEHPNLVSVLDVDVTDSGLAYLVMELASGHTLREAHTRIGDARFALSVLLQMCEGLEVVHQASIVHRDLKPENVLLLDAIGAAHPRVKIADFGLATLADGKPLGRETISEGALQTDPRRVRFRPGDRRIDPLGATLPSLPDKPRAEPRSTPGNAHDEPLQTQRMDRSELPEELPVFERITRTGMLLGTPLYMAPELALGRLTPAADLFGVGVIAYELLTGKHPFDSAPILLFGRGEWEIPETLREVAGVPFYVARSLEQCLARHAEKRPTATDLVNVLRAHDITNPARPLMPARLSYPPPAAR